MMELPDKFEAVDPVSGNPWKCEMVTFGSTPQAPSRQTYLKMNEVNPGGHEMMSHVQPEIARALIQYGRDLERAEIENQEYWCSECQDHVHELPCGRCVSIGSNLPIGWDRNL